MFKRFTLAAMLASATILSAQTAPAPAPAPVWQGVEATWSETTSHGISH